MFSLEEIAELCRVSKQTIRKWIVKESLIEFRLDRIGACKVKPVVTTDQVLKLLDLKRPIFGTGSVAEQIFQRERASKSKAGLIASANRVARLQRELEKAKEQS